MIFKSCVVGVGIVKVEDPDAVGSYGTAPPHSTIVTMLLEYGLWEKVQIIDKHVDDVGG